MSDHTEELLTLFHAYLNRISDETLASYLRDIDWTMPPRISVPRVLPCLRHLDRLTDLAVQTAQPIVRHLAGHAAEWPWGQTYTSADFGEDFLQNYGWLEVFGTRGLFANDTIAAGFLILGPRIVYPPHHHLAEEIYVPLTPGTLWQKGEADLVRREAGEVIHHPSNVSHAMRIGDDPLIAIYLWRGGPLAQKSVIAPPVTGAF